MGYTSKPDTLSGLDALIAAVEERLSRNPDYIELMALRKARVEIRHASYRTRETMVDDQTGETMVLVGTGTFEREATPSQIGASLSILAKVGHPLTTSELVQMVRAAGATVGGKNPNVNLGSTLSRSEELKSVRWRGAPAWWFKHRPMPSVIMVDATNAAAELELESVPRHGVAAKAGPSS